MAICLAADKRSSIYIRVRNIIMFQNQVCPGFMYARQRAMERKKRRGEVAAGRMASSHCPLAEDIRRCISTPKDYHHYYYHHRYHATLRIYIPFLLYIYMCAGIQDNKNNISM